MLHYGVCVWCYGICAWGGYLALVINCMQKLENLVISLSDKYNFVDTSHNNMNIRHYLL